MTADHGTYATDLAVVVADSTMRAVFETLLGQRRSVLGLRGFRFDMFVHPQRDVGVATGAVDLLRRMLRTHRLALVAFDHHGSGRQGDATSVADRVELDLSQNGCSRRACAVCISPELEAWTPFGSRVMAQALGRELADLARALEPFGYPGTKKPGRPKEAFEAALRWANKRVSPVIYSEIAERANLDECSDPAFARLRAFLREHFAAYPEPS